MNIINTNSIEYLFEPRSFAIIGASQNPNKIGHTIVKNIQTGGYKGKIFPVNRTGSEILGLPGYKNIEDINEEIDVASIVIPSHLVVDAVKKCGEMGVKHIQVITSGFSEVGNHKDEHEIQSIAASYGMRILGPNIFGIYSAAASLNSTFSATNIKKGNVAIITQSGALGIAMIGRTAVENIGLSAIVSTGNKCDIDEADLLTYLIHQKETRVILIYIEGIRNGERLIPLLKEASLIKPIVVIKSGRSKRGAMAAASHTGSLAGADNIFDAIIKQCGVLRAESLEEAFNWCKFLSVCPKPKGKKGVIVTNGGGIGVMATDACEKYDIELFDNQETLKNVFEPATPSFGSTKNPIDITGGAMAEDYDLALNAPTGSEDMDATIALYCETATFDSDNLSPMIRHTYKNHIENGKPVVYTIVGGESVEKSIIELKRENIPVFGDVYEAISSLGAVYRFYDFQKQYSMEIDEVRIDFGAIDKIIDKALDDDRHFLLADEARKIMEIADVPIPVSKVARTITEAVTIAKDIGYPLVMKVVSRDIIHKSDAGGIALDLQNRDEVINAFEAIMQNSKSYNPDAVIEGVELAEMIEPGIELVAGAIRDATFGPVVMCGLGGIYIEVLKDVSFRSYPLNKKEIMSMLQETQSFPLLLGVRGEQQKDINGVIDIIIKIGTILYQCKKISDIEINPLRVFDQDKGLKALDVRILLSNPKEEQ